MYSIVLCHKETVGKKQMMREIEDMCTLAERFYRLHISRIRARYTLEDKKERSIFAAHSVMQIIVSGATLTPLPPCRMNTFPRLCAS